ncbi:PAP2 superfamily protein [Colletotrichum paranaense]|uniref:PAP2 superfamily protein n=6 Tax=Colletotrichum acutatum species complex TaxID=2707335 RepID=A0A9P9XIU5_9PEZI|nr:PAP2 superfamily protein [Colletotrichum lupini]XP_060304252.1 PAP2 superfamily protein [Colletotrichum costaricense]XP_060350765.1 PAP2 superfamily protein [Colletotrichum paranaense]XP_060382654.1 PAP2 superfamily protein [Colletotrichum tamarilloi]XP_060405154.1 PAP2 superfamily protein [Colletotrichum abscissum]KAI3548481.1 PAP2 superfamily protein [Colletotrichum filicis]KXH43743.1 PAP2 superfamily protein [Colletotrichum simmondsii]KAI3554755.1 PAP2 superfamily protein [Colletotrich
MSSSIPLANLSPSSRPSYYKMPESPAPYSRRRPHRGHWTPSLIGSYVFDWLVLAVVGGIATVLGIVEPNKRPFSVLDPNISFPFTHHETVPMWLAAIIAVAGPIIVIAAVCLILVPGNTVPKGTPKSLIWKRKLWELHVGYLGLALAHVGAFFITNGMKNMFGKPRPDLLSRCQPDLANIQKYIVGGTSANITGLTGAAGFGQLVSAAICTNTDSHTLNDGFRSYPSGHSSSAAAGLIYLSLFLASKFAVTLPFVASDNGADSHSAFPSRIKKAGSGYEEVGLGESGSLNPDSTTAARNLAEHNKVVTAVRRQAAAPPIYLLTIVVIPWFASIFIAGSRWFDFRHHGFDILFGYMIGIFTSIFAFRYYHLPITQGAGWAWGPRSHDKAWWSGVGSYSYATDKGDFIRPGDEEEAYVSRPVIGQATSTQYMGKQSSHDEPEAENRF